MATTFTYDLENNLTSITGPTGRQEGMAYDQASRLTSYTANSGKRIQYDYDKLDDLAEKAYTDATGQESAAPAEYTYDALGRRLTMTDSTGETVYSYDALGRLTEVTTYRKPAAGNSASAFSHAEGSGGTIGYTYNAADDLAAITYPDGTEVSYEYDLNGNLTKVTGRRGEMTTYEYDTLNRPVAEHRPNGISTYKAYNARNQIVELTNQCDDCGWVLGRYAYTYDNRGYIVAEHAEEAREMDPYGREPYASYKPEKQGENCDHGRNRSLAYRLLVTDNTFTYDDAGKLLTATEAEEGCSTVAVWIYSYDLMGNLTEKTQYQAAKELLEETATEDGTQDAQSENSEVLDASNDAQDGTGASGKSVNVYNTTNILEKVSKIDAASSEKYVYNESNQLSEATICDGKTTKKVCYTYDEDGNLIQEYSPTDRSLTYYQYTVEDRLEAVYSGNSYNKTMQMAAAYDGDGNRVYQLNYNPEKDEDFSDYYCSYKNCDYNGTGIQLQAGGEVSQAEKDLIALIKASGAVGNSQYELIEYLNDVNREYVEVLVEQNINGRTDTVYTYGNERISREMFNQTSRTAYYLYDPRGSVSGLTDAKAHLTKTYRYSANGELTYGSAKYENEYTYNGESYNPNIRSQYLRARYYSVVHASFLTEDSYLGNIAEPLTLNRYNYCVSSWVNYEDPSGYTVIKDLWDGICNWRPWNSNAPKPVYLDPQPITTPSPEPWLLPNIQSEYSSFYEDDNILPVGGIGYILRAPGEHFDKYLEEQRANAEENNRNELCEPEEHNIIDLREKFEELVLEDPTLTSTGDFMREYYTEDVIAFLQKMADRESYGGDYSAVGRDQYLGKYQLGRSALEDIGFVLNEEKKSENYIWTEKANAYGIYSNQDFLDTPIAQEVAMVLVLRKNYSYVRKRNQDEYIGQTISWKNAKGEEKEVTVTLSGLLAASHLVGNGDLNKGLTGKMEWAEVVDGNRVPALEYMEKMGGYNLEILLGGIE
ncbi:MAG: hypothetical protein NC427_06105 [Ruminococcus flavefaciens]|nr:hypothetical protein [Ruminococcus flavefaciens]